MNSPQLPYFQYLGHRREPFGEQVFYWLHWRDEDGFIQVIVDFAAARKITEFFLGAASHRGAPAPVDLPKLQLTCNPNTLTIAARDDDRVKTLIFDRQLYRWMSFTVGMSGLAIRGVGAVVHDLPTLLRDHPELRSLVEGEPSVPS